MDVTIANTPHHKGRMNFNFTSRVFQVLFILGGGYISRFSDCLTVSAVYEQNIAKFKCTISPYTSFQRWSIDSVDVADCGAVLCSVNSSNPVEYSFTTDVITGIFVFKIDPIKSTDDKRIVECFDGTDTKSITIDLTVNNPNGEDESDCPGWCIAVIIVGGVLLVVGVVVLIVKTKPDAPKSALIHYCDRTFKTSIYWTKSTCWYTTKIEYLVTLTNQDQELTFFENCNERFCETRHLILNEDYTLKIVAYNCRTSDPLTINIKIVPGIEWYCITTSPKECCIEWKDEDSSLYILEYIKDIDWVKERRNKNNAVLDQLTPSCVYGLRVYFFDQYWCRLLEFNLKEEGTFEYQATENRVRDEWKPVVTITVVTVPYETGCYIRWTVSGVIGGLYILEYRLTSEIIWHKKEKLLRKNSTTLKSLKPNTEYLIRIFALGQRNMFHSSAIHEFKTTNT